jgi:ribosomal protein S18 acetylase RimI-like enzyme
LSDAVHASSAIRVRELRPTDFDDVVRIDARHTGEAKPDYWREVLGRFLGPVRRPATVGLAATDERGVVGYLLGEVRAFEFGSEACGWLFGIGVDPERLRSRVASRLLAESCRRFAAAGVTRVRTMVGRNNVPVLSFFRANGFAAGSFVQLELELREVE